MLWWVWNPSLSLYHYPLLQRDWFCWAIIIYHGEGYCRHNSSVDNNLHTTAICPDVVRTSGALPRRIVCHASCHPLGFFICERKAAADMDNDLRTWSAIPRAFVEIHSSREKWSLAASSGVISIWNQTLQLYYISPGRFLDTLLEGYESTLWDEMSQTPLFRGERLLPMRSLTVGLKTGISSGSSEVWVIRQTRKSVIKSNVSSQFLISGPRAGGDFRK